MSAVIKNTTDEVIIVKTYDAFSNTQWTSRCHVSIAPHQEATVFGGVGKARHFYAYVHLGDKCTPWPGYMVQPENVYEIAFSSSQHGNHKDGNPTLKFSFPPHQDDSDEDSDEDLTELQRSQKRCQQTGRELMAIREHSTISGIASLLAALKTRYVSVGTAKTSFSATAVAGAGMVVFPATMPAGLAILGGSAVGGLVSSSAKQAGSSAEVKNFQQLCEEDEAAMERFHQAVENYERAMEISLQTCEMSMHSQGLVTNPNQPKLKGSNHDKNMVGFWGVASGGVGWGTTEASVLALQGGTRISATLFGTALASAGALVMIADTVHSWATGKVNEKKFQEAVTGLKKCNEKISQMLESIKLGDEVEYTFIDNECDDECPICAANLVDMRLPCGHKMCRDCLDRWAAQHVTEHVSQFPCPFCRQVAEC